MRRYFLIAKEVGALTRAFCAKLEAEQPEVEAAGPVARSCPARRGGRRPLDAPGFHDRGRPADGARAPKIFERDPVNLLRLFMIADAPRPRPAPRRLHRGDPVAALITSKVRRDPEAAKVFLDVLARGRRPTAPWS